LYRAWLKLYLYENIQQNYVVCYVEMWQHVMLPHLHVTYDDIILFTEICEHYSTTTFRATINENSL